VGEGALLQVRADGQIRSRLGWDSQAGRGSCSPGRHRDRMAVGRSASPMAVGVSGLLPEPSGYAELLKAPVRASRVRTAGAANSELLQLYWSVGRDILNRQEQAGWGSRVIDRLAQDLGAEFPDQRGWSRSNLHYMRSPGRGVARHRSCPTGCGTTALGACAGPARQAHHPSGAGLVRRAARPVRVRPPRAVRTDRGARARAGADGPAAADAAGVRARHGFVGRKVRFDVDGDGAELDLLLFWSSNCATTSSSSRSAGSTRRMSASSGLRRRRRRPAAPQRSARPRWGSCCARAATTPWSATTWPGPPLRWPSRTTPTTPCRPKSAAACPPPPSSPPPWNNRPRRPGAALDGWPARTQQITSQSAAPGQRLNGRYRGLGRLVDELDDTPGQIRIALVQLDALCAAQQAPTQAVRRDTLG